MSKIILTNPFQLSHTANACQNKTLLFKTLKINNLFFLNIYKFIKSPSSIFGKLKTNKKGCFIFSAIINCIIIVFFLTVGIKKNSKIKTLEV